MTTSVIIPAYMAQDFLCRCLDAIDKQTVQPDEILIGVDSCRETLKVCADLMEQNNKIKVFYFPEHAGCYRIRNTLAILATGDTLVLFDADDVMYPNYIEYMTDLVKPGTFCRPNFVDVQVNGDRILRTTPAKGCISIKRNDLIDNSGWEPWQCGADNEFNCRSARRGMTWVQTGDSVFDRFIHGDNLTESTATNGKSKYRKMCTKVTKEREKINFTRDTIAIARCILMENKSEILRYLSTMGAVVNFGFDGNMLTGEIISGTEIIQKFKPLYSQLKQIRLMCATYMRKNQGNIRVSIIKETIAIYTETVDVSGLFDNEFININCNIKLDVGSVYELVINGIDSNSGSAITLKLGEFNNNFHVVLNNTDTILELNSQFIYNDVTQYYHTNSSKVSIIVPIYNTSKYLRNLLKSIKGQCYENYEIILVDDGSSKSDLKKTRNIIKEFDMDITLLWNKTNKGAPATRNKGADKATGEYLLFCDSDVILSPQMLENMVNKIQTHGYADWVYSNYQIGNTVWSFWEWDAERFHVSNCSSTMSLIRASKFPRWDESIKRFQDWDLFLTMYENGSVGVWLDEILFLAGDRQDGITNNSIDEDEARKVISEKHK